MIQLSQFVQLAGRRPRYNIFDWFKDIASGDITAWIVLGCIAGFIAFCVLYQKFTGKSFVKRRKERREARHRRKHVIWEYRRDKN